MSSAVPTAANCGGDANLPRGGRRPHQPLRLLDNGVPPAAASWAATDSINQDFFRESFQIGYDRFFGTGDVTHELHVGYQWYEDAEELNRTSNGWGEIDVIGGPVRRPRRELLRGAASPAGGHRGLPGGNPIQLRDVRVPEHRRSTTSSAGRTGPSTSESLVSNDELFGQGLRENSSNLSGFELAPGNKYKMYEIPWEDMIQPRLGAVWAYNGDGARCTPTTPATTRRSARCRAPPRGPATRNQVLDVFFDADGNQLLSEQFGGSSGKFFQEDMDPRARSTSSWWATARQLRQQVDGPGPCPLPQRQQLLGGHQQHRPVALAGA